MIFNGLLIFDWLRQKYSGEFGKLFVQVSEKIAYKKRCYQRSFSDAEDTAQNYEAQQES